MKLFDISVTVDDTIPVWEGDARPELGEEITYFEEGTIQTTTVKMNVHTGTHIDAPRHFFQDGKIASEIDLECLNGVCKVIEVHAKSGLITKQDLTQVGFNGGFERVLIKTGNSALWESQGNEFFKSYVALDLSAAEYLFASGAKLVGIDYLSIAPFNNVWDVHQELLIHEVVIMEGLNLSDVEPGKYELLCLPMKIHSKDGLPVRAVLRK